MKTLKNSHPFHKSFSKLCPVKHLAIYQICLNFLKIPKSQKNTSPTIHPSFTNHSPSVSPRHRGHDGLIPGGRGGPQVTGRKHVGAQTDETTGLDGDVQVVTLKLTYLICISHIYIYRYIYRQIDRQIDICRYTDRERDGWIDGWIDRLDRQMVNTKQRLKEVLKSDLYRKASRNVRRNEGCDIFP